MGELLGVSTSSEITIALLSWLVELVHTELKDRLCDVEIEVIGVEYLGAYPAIGIHYTTPETDDLGPRRRDRC